MGYTGKQRREYQRKWLLERREKAIEYLGGCCVTCGSVEELEFDHIDRSLKSHSVSTLISRRWEVLQEELDKCQLLCYTCHKEKTISELSYAEHGTTYYYGRFKCRCDLCKAAKKLDNDKRFQ